MRRPDAAQGLGRAAAIANQARDPRDNATRGGEMLEYATSGGEPVSGPDATPTITRGKMIKGADLPFHDATRVSLAGSYYIHADPKDVASVRLS